MATIFANLISGVTTDNPLLIGATTLNSANLASLPTVTGPQTMWITLDPTGVNGAPEIVQVTAHTASATSCTIVRAQQSTVARSHPLSTSWIVPFTKTDVDGWITESKIEMFGIAMTDEVTALTTGTAKVTMRMPFAMTLNAGNAGVRANVNTVSSSGLPTIDIKKNGVSIFSTLLTINVSSKTSIGATTPVVLSATTFADDDEVTFDITIAGTGTKGLKIWLIGSRP